MSMQLVALLANIALAVLKFTVGYIAASRALTADAFNSAGDVLATFVAWLAFRYARVPPDENHHYGHQNAEALAGLLLGAVLCATGVFICIDGLIAALTHRNEHPPDRIALGAAGVTIVVKAALYRASIRIGRRTHSPTLLASARDHRADVVTGSVALLGIAIANLGFPSVDAAAGGVIGVYVFLLGIAPVRDNIGILMLEAPAEITERAAVRAAEIDGVTAVRQIRVQPHGGRFRIDMVLAVQADWTVSRAHQLAHEVERAVRDDLPRVTEVHVHVEPDAPGR